MIRCLFWLALLLPFYATAVDYWLDQPLAAKWQQYLAVSDQLLQQDASAFAAELAGKAAQQAVKHNEFGLTAIATAAEAEAVLSYQTPSGGWSKRTDMRQQRNRGQHYGSEPDYVPTFDNDATSTQLQWLADYYPKAPQVLQKRIAAAIERGITFVVAAQYPNGGFAQSYPLRGDYHDAITLNDHALYQIMLLLWQAGHDNRFAMLTQSTRQAALATFYRAVDWLLANQVKVKGQLTVWGAQHHPLNGEPVAARKFEQASLVSTESAKLLLLMLQTVPDYPGVATSLAAGAHWLRQHQITDKTRFRDEQGYLSLKNSPGSVIWSRFYDLQSGEPVFFDRDGETYTDVSQISLERQRGYGWYQSVAEEFLLAYDKYLTKRDE